LRMLSQCHRGELQHGARYTVEGTPCAEVLGQQMRIFPERVRELFPRDVDLGAHGVEAYAGFPLTAVDGRPLGLIAVMSSRPLVHLKRVEATLQIYGMRAAAELERI